MDFGHFHYPGMLILYTQSRDDGFTFMFRYIMSVRTHVINNIAGQRGDLYFALSAPSALLSSVFIVIETHTEKTPNISSQPLFRYPLI
jgi:hypothetical protein